MDIVAEAQNAKQEQERKQRLLGFLSIFEEEMAVKNELKQAKTNLKDAILKYFDEAEAI